MYLKINTKKQRKIQQTIFALFFLLSFLFFKNFPLVLADNSVSSTPASQTEAQNASSTPSNPTATTSSSTVDNTKDQQIADKLVINQQKLLQLNQQIKDYQSQISTAQNKSDTLKNEINIYDEQIQSIELQIEANQTEIENKNIQINQLKDLISQKNLEIESNKQVLAQLIVELNQYDDEFALKTTIGSSNLSKFLDQIEYTKNLQSQIYQLVQKIKTLKDQLSQQQKNLEIQVTQLTELENELQANQNSLTDVRNQKQELLKQTQGLEKNYQRLLASSKQDAVNLQKEITDLDAQIRAKIGKKTISGIAGVLAWPIDGILTQGYGNTGFTSLGYNFHNGIDIAGPAGRPIYAAADGVVYDTDQSEAAFGNWVALKSTVKTSSGAAEIITLYGHMRTFVVKTGDQLSQGDLIGYEGNTGNTTAKIYGPERGYHLHFGVYDVDGFGVSAGKYTNIYGNYKIPYGYTYNPLNFLPPQ